MIYNLFHNRRHSIKHDVLVSVIDEVNEKAVVAIVLAFLKPTSFSLAVFSTS